MPIHGWSRDRQSNSGVQRYSDIGGGGIGVSIHGWSGNCQSNSDVCGYSNMGGIGVPIDRYPGTVRVTLDSKVEATHDMALLDITLKFRSYF